MSARKSFKTFSATNVHYISQLLYRNVCSKYNRVGLFRSASLTVFRNKAAKLLIDLGEEDVEMLIVAEYR